MLRFSNFLRNSIIHFRMFLYIETFYLNVSVSLLCRLQAVLLSLKEVGNAMLNESEIHPISPKTPAPQYQPIDKKKREGKIVEDYIRDRAA